ncbi:MAG TPA: NAD(P)-binding domain-containing protein [Blastocatellia bacterium]|nr:NAD(P)-binding domain-containing protein [Blastocatellia bacterium]
MATKSRFIIKRKDKSGDDIVLESEGLTIGRLPGNDLVLNSRAVSRTHAGIREFNGEYWIFNLSESNGTVLNGWLVDKTPLLDGDVIQIGSYSLLANYVQGALSLTVQMDAEIHPIEGTSSRVLFEEDLGKTLIVQIPGGIKKQAVAPGGTERFQMGTGIFSAVSPLAIDEQALNVFWDKRRREAGKIAPQTLLHPRTNKKVGKAQFNWRPSLDLSRIWRKSYFYWGAAVVVLLAIAAVLVYESAYSPGQVSTAHTSSQMSARAIALKPNQNSCSNCHGVTEGMQDKCVTCHTTPATQTAQGFAPVLFDKHVRENIGCTGCHVEHQGASSELGLKSNQLCSNCHNGSYTIKTGDKAGQILPVAHGGSVGYPVVNGKWTKMLDANQLKVRALPETWAGPAWDSNRQFHSIHQLGRMENRMSCKDCHTTGVRGEASFRESPRAECAKCHDLVAGAAGTQRVRANCYTCHRQHGRSEDLLKLVAAGKDERHIKDYFAKIDSGKDEVGKRLATASENLFSGVGGADKIRQDKDTLSAGMLSSFGGLPWYGWVGLIGILPIGGLAVMAVGTARRKHSLQTVKVDAAPNESEVAKALVGVLDLEKLKAEEAPYPHPVINQQTCIGCHACVEACPHDVLAIVNGVSTPINPDQCMEDTSCQVECPTNPKSCVVINTKKKILERKVPKRDQRFKTNVEGIYLIGDVSGVPLIKNAINEGATVIDCIVDDLKKEGPNAKAEVDVAVVGIGPAGLSAAVIAKQRGLKYVAIEQDKIVATIQQVYPAGKYVFFKPDTVETKGGIPLPGPGDSKENMLKGWLDAMTSNGVVVNEEETCRDIKQDGGVFTVTTEKGKAKEKVSYTARKIIIAIGNRGTPMKLRVPGEDLKVMMTPPPVVPKFCPSCGSARKGSQQFCVVCGTPYAAKAQPAYETGKVQFKLSDPDDYVNKKCIIVGAGNSSIEAAVDLAGLKRDGERISFTRNNDVTLVVRSDFKGDLKLGNKMNVYDCIDSGKIKVFFRTEIKEITQNEVVLMDVRSKEEKARLANDFVFALIGGEKPTKFLEGLGIKIG